MPLEGLSAEIGEKAYRVAKENLGKLGLTEEELKDQRILDLGSGRSEIGEYLLSRGVDCVSLDWDIWELALLGSERRTQADAARLPFAPESFDCVISSMGPPMLAGLEGKRIVTKAGEEDYRRFRKDLAGKIAEIKRVLKPGGEFRVFPPILQFLANQAYLRTKDVPKAEFERTTAEAERESIALYEKLGLAGVQRCRGTKGAYLVWVKPRNAS